MSNNNTPEPKRPTWLSKYRHVVNDNGYELMGAYVAGVMDSTSSITVSVAPQQNTRLGYTIVPRILMERHQEHLIGVVDNWALEHGINAKVKQHESNSGQKYTYSIQSRGDVRKFLELIKPYIVVKHDTIEIILNEILPRLEEGRHKTKEGFVETIEYADMVRESTARSNYKYDADYFLEEWSDELQA